MGKKLVYILVLAIIIGTGCATKNDKITKWEDIEFVEE